MIADPCNADLVPGLYGSSEGFLARVKSTIFNDSEGSSGYLLWAPRLHNKQTAINGGGNTFLFNVFFYTTNDSSTPPPLASYGAVTTFAQSLASNEAGRGEDPAAQLIGPDNAIVMDARTLSACMRLTYAGRMDESAGQVAFVQNLPLEAVLGDANQGESPITVDDLFRLSTAVQRLGVDTLENVHRSHEVNGPVFRDSRDGALEAADGWAAQAPIIAETSRVSAPAVFGFAWKSLTVGAGNGAKLSFNLIKNVEWRASPTSGFTSVTPRTINTTNKVAEVHKKLDLVNPSWSRRVIDSAGSLAGEVVKMAATGIAGLARKEGSALLRRLPGMLEGIGELGMLL